MPPPDLVWLGSVSAFTRNLDLNVVSICYYSDSHHVYLYRIEPVIHDLRKQPKGDQEPGLGMLSNKINQSIKSRIYIRDDEATC